MVLEKRKPLLAYVISIVYLLVVAVTYTSLHPNLLNFGVWSSALGFGIWLFYLHRSRKPLRYPRILLLIGAYMLLRFITTTQAPFPIISFEVALRELILLFGFLFVFNSLDLFWKPRTWEDTLINFALVFCFIELGLAYFWHSIWVDITGSFFPLPPIGYRSPGVFLGHPNILAGFLNLVAPIMVVRMIREKNWGKRALWGVGLIIFVPTIYFTSSRTGLMAGIIGVFATLFFLYVPSLYQKLRDRRRKSLWEIVPRRFFLLALVSLVVISGFIVFFLIQSQRISTHAPTLISARSGIWGAAIETIRKSPILGHGPGTFSVFYAQETKIPPGFATSHAHNILLQVAAETGLIGVLLVVGILLMGTIVFIRTWRSSSANVKPRMAAYAGAGIAVLSHHTLDYLFESPLYAVGVFIIFALVLRESPSSERMSARTGRAILTPVTILIAFLAGSAYTSVGASIYWDGVTAGRNGDWDTATREICLAYETRPEITLYGFQCSLAQAQLSYRNENPDDLQESLRILREAIEKDSYWPIHWANLAALEWENGEFDSSVNHMQNALDFAPKNRTIVMNLAWMEEVRGSQEDSTNAYSQALTANPWAQFDTVFQTSPAARKALERFDRGENDEAPWFLVIQGWKALTEEKWDDARDIFLQSIQNDPTDGLAYAGLAYAQQQLGQVNDAKTNMYIATFLESSSPLVLHTAGAFAQGQDREEDALQYFQSTYNLIENLSYSPSYYNRTYYRFFLSSDLVPQMRRGGLTPDIVESFRLLAQHYDENGESDKAEEIRIRIAVEVEVAMP